MKIGFQTEIARTTPRGNASEIQTLTCAQVSKEKRFLTHASRHAVWECSHCAKVYCDECIRKLRRVGGTHLKLCPSCSNPCLLTAWSEMMRKKKKGFFSSLASKISDGIKRTTRPLSR